MNRSENTTFIGLNEVQSLTPSEAEAIYQTLRAEMSARWNSSIAPHRARTLAKLAAIRTAAGGHHAENADRMGAEAAANGTEYDCLRHITAALAIRAGRYDEVVRRGGNPYWTGDPIINAAVAAVVAVRKAEISK